MPHTPQISSLQRRSNTENTAERFPAIEALGITKAYGRVSILREVSFKLDWGECLTILGPNGCGKTTLVKILSGLARPDAGLIKVSGLKMASFGRHIRSLVGVVTHDTLLYNDLTAYENLKFTSRMFQLDDMDDRIQTVADSMGVGHLLHQKVWTLSHGLRKRFTICRALIHKPHILLLDEPESGLDVESQMLFDSILNKHTECDKSIILTTHSLERAIAVSDRIGILSGGRIVRQYTPGDGLDSQTLLDIYAQYGRPKL